MTFAEIGLTILQAFWFIAPAYAANAFPPLVRGKKPIDRGKKFFGNRLLGNGKRHLVLWKSCSRRLTIFSEISKNSNLNQLSCSFPCGSGCWMLNKRGNFFKKFPSI